MKIRRFLVENSENTEKIHRIIVQAMRIKKAKHIKKLKQINRIKHILLIAGCILFFLSSISIESSDLRICLGLGIFATILVFSAILLEKYIVAHSENPPQTVFAINEVETYYQKWLRANNLTDTIHNFNYFCSKYAA